MRFRHSESCLFACKVALSMFVGAAMGWTSTLRADPAMEVAALFSHSVPLHQTGAGSYTVNATVGGVEAELLLDTGASMVTVSSSLFKQIRKQGKATRIRRVGARLASGKVEVLDVYSVQHFSLGYDCELGPVEVAVLKNGGRNLLGMNVLELAAPFVFTASPPALGLSKCGVAKLEVSMRE